MLPQKRSLSAGMHDMIAAVHKGGRPSKKKQAEHLNVDLGVHIEQAANDLGVFQESAVGRARDTEEVVRSRTATWQNIARLVEERIGHGFKISEATVRHCVAAQRSSSTVAALHKPIAAVLRRKFARASDEWHVDGHFSNKLVKCAITTALHRRRIGVSWDDHACSEFNSSTFTKLLVFMSSRLHEAAPYSDATVVTGQLKCVRNTVLLYLPKECGSPASHVSQKYEFKIRKVPFGVTRVVSERRSNPMQQINDLQLVLSQPQVRE